MTTMPVVGCIGGGIFKEYLSGPLVPVRWQCEAHTWALVAEYLTVRHTTGTTRQ